MRDAIISFGLLLSCALAAQSPALEFEVASIKRNTTNTFMPGPDGNGLYWMSNVTLADMIVRAYPTDTGPREVLNAPDWAMSERYDVLANGKPLATVEERQQMWRALLFERSKLQVHYEAREQPGYRMVLARDDRRLGPGLKPSSLQCVGQAAFPSQAAIRAADSPEQFAAQRCGFMAVRTDTGPTCVSGGVSMRALAGLLSGFVQRPVIDETGLAGDYAVRFSCAVPAPTPGAAGGASITSPAENPSVFVVVEEELGVKLRSDRVTVRTLVIDHIERPSEN